MKLDDLVDIINLKEFEFFNIQYTDEQDEVDDFFKDHGIKINNIEGVDPFNDLLGLTDFLNTCDFVITVSNTNAHLAASLGIPTYLLLPLSKGKFWYWSNEKNNKNLWYPSIIKFQQSEDGSWADPVQRLKNTYKKNIKLFKFLICGAGEGIRTLDFNLGKVALYPELRPLNDDSIIIL